MSRKFIVFALLAASLQLGCDTVAKQTPEPAVAAAPAVVAAPVATPAPVATAAAAKSPKPWPKPERYEKEIAAFEAADKLKPPPQGAIVAIGSSSMRGWHKSIHEDLAPLTVIARGFGGSCMNDALFYTDRIVLAYKPRAVVLYEGDNDIAGGYGVEQFIASVNAFVDRIHKADPATRIYLMSVKPSPSRWNFWPEVQRANGLLKEIAEKDKLVTYIDVATPMLKADGTPMDGIYLNDNLHMKPAGYAIWTAAVKPVLMQWEAAAEKKK